MPSSGVNLPPADYDGAWKEALATQRTVGDPARRLGERWELPRRLYERGYGKQDILELYRLLDWLMAPEEQTVDFHRQLHQFEEERAMPYITTIERMGLQQGRQEGLLQSVLDALEARFGEVPYPLREQLLAVADTAELKRLHREAVLVPDLVTFERALRRE